MRRWLTLVLFLAIFTLPRLAWAGPYLNTAAMLLREGFQACDWVRVNLDDKQLAGYAQQVARTRVDVASKMVVPDEVRQAHPHLLLALAAQERALDAAINGRVAVFLSQVQVARGEKKTLDSVLKSANLSLPTLASLGVESSGSVRWAAGDRGKSHKAVQPRRRLHVGGRAQTATRRTVAVKPSAQWARVSQPSTGPRGSSVP